MNDILYEDYGGNKELAEADKEYQKLNLQVKNYEEGLKRSNILIKNQEELVKKLEESVKRYSQLDALRDTFTQIYETSQNGGSTELTRLKTQLTLWTIKKCSLS